MKLIFISVQVLMVLFFSKGTAGSYFGDFPSPRPRSMAGAQVITGKNTVEGQFHT